MVRIIDDSILTPDGVHEFACRVRFHPAQRRHRIIGELWVDRIREIEKVVKIMIATAAHEIIIVQRKNLFEQRKHLLGYVGIVEEARGHALLPLAQRFLHLLQQVTGKFILNVKLRIPGKLRCVNTNDFMVSEDLRKTESHHIIQEHDVMPLIDLRKGHESRQL